MCPASPPTAIAPAGEREIAAEVLARIRGRFVVRCREDHAALSQVEISAGFLKDPERCDALIQTVHRIAGSGGTFGFSDLGLKASAVESLLLEHRPPLEIERAMAELLAELAIAGSAL